MSVGALAHPTHQVSRSLRAVPIQFLTQKRTKSGNPDTQDAMLVTFGCAFIYTPIVERLPSTVS